ncbi:MAG: MAPEG family protein [Pseudomonadales bacterium]|jgi:glutathione S-transferase|nr:MAPEG family protein [Pseudomonadales bacterium]MDA0761613.1 MAPEG family protein [Pseudomonadota bacterium]MDA0957579.1 MAPEG family protein [Pseudomonadota bacterium]MDA1207441.1 MAPEG family protein [Pseudomonadota bacterium]
MELVGLISLLAVLQFVVFGILVGRARGVYGVKAPATTGHEQFERWFRVHYNTLEKLIVFLPALWLFGYYVGQYYAAGLGLIYLVGRLLYAVSYTRDPASRTLGTLVSELPILIMIIGGIIAISLDLAAG